MLCIPIGYVHTFTAQLSAQRWDKEVWPPGGGGALRYRMATHCQTAARSGSGERQNIGAVNSLEGKKGGAVNFKL